MSSEKQSVPNAEIPGVAPKKRSRTENWLDQDKLLLQELVRERVHVIENKNTDANTNKKKRDAWNDLLNTFNSICTGAQRTLNQLKTQWTTIKINVKKEKAHYRREISKTGGGPHPKEPGNQDADDISSWLPMEFVIDHNEYDCDSTAVPQTSASSIKVVLDPVEVVPPPEDFCTPLEVSTPLEVPTPVKVSTPLELSTPLEVISIPYAVEDPNEEVSHLSTDTAVIFENQTHEETKKINKIKKQKLKKKAKPQTTPNETTASAAGKIAELEMKCRQELHNIQMENERKRSRNLDLKFEVLSAKLNYYKNKNNV